MRYTLQLIRYYMIPFFGMLMNQVHSRSEVPPNIHRVDMVMQGQKGREPLV